MAKSKGFNITGAVKKKGRKFGASIEAPFINFQKEVYDKQIAAIQEATFLIHATAVKSIQSNTGGTPTQRYKPDRIVNVSRPGSAPNTDTGRLVQSIKFDFQKGGTVGRVGTNLKYGKDLEFGTKKMKARPWLSSAITEVSKQIADIFKRSMTNAIKASKQ